MQKVYILTGKDINTFWLKTKTSIPSLLRLFKAFKM